MIFNSNLRFINKKFGKNGVEMLQAKLKEMGSDIDLSSIKDKDWYPIEARGDFLVAVLKQFLEPRNRTLFDFAREAPKNRGVLSFFVKYTLNPNKPVDKGPGIWNQYYNFGNVIVKENVEGRALMHIEDFVVDMEPDVEAMVLEYTSGFFTGAFELTGAKDVKVDIKLEQEDGMKFYKVELGWK